MGAGVGGGQRWEEDRPDGCSWGRRAPVASSRGLRALGCGMGVRGAVPEEEEQIWGERCLSLSHSCTE